MEPTAVEQRVGWTRGLLAALAGALLVLRITRWTLLEGVALALGLLAAVLFVPLARRWANEVGPRHLLDPSFALGLLLLLIFALHGPMGLPDALVLVTHPLLGATATMLAVGAGRLGTPPRPARGSIAGATGAALAGVGVLAGGPVGLLGHGALMLGLATAWWLLQPVPDPTHPGAGPLDAFVPWATQPSRGWPGVARLPLHAPATLAYLAVSWILFLRLGEPVPDGFGLDTSRYEAFLYHIPDLSQAPLEAAASLVTAPFLNHDDVQIVYVTVLLLLFGTTFEAHEGTLRASFVFLVTGLAGALAAGVLLHGLHPLFPGNDLLSYAWQRTWSGGSAGAFGLMGAIAARARRPAPLLGFFAFWELNVGLWYLRGYTPAFHVTALVAGYALARYTLAPNAPDQGPRVEDP